MLEQEINEANHQAWLDFCEQLKEAGSQIIREEAASDVLNNSEGYRYLTRLLRIGLEMHMEFSDAEFPGFFSPSHETAKIGADNPDNLYSRASLNGNNSYRVFGNRGTVHYLSFACQKGGYEEDGTLHPAGFIDASALHCDANGDFELYISPEEKPGNCLIMERDCNCLIVRQTFHDRKTEIPAQLNIERLECNQQPPSLSAENLQQGLHNTARFVQGTSKLFADWAQGWKPLANTLPLMDPSITTAVGGDANILYYHGYWQLKADEALIVTLAHVPACDTWNLQINNYWMESLDYRYHRICFNKHNAQYNTGGSVTLVLAHRDPGCANWLETAQHQQGTWCFRWVGVDLGANDEKNMVPHCQRVPWDEVKNHAH